MSSVTLDVLLLLCAILQAVPVLRSRVLFLSYCTSAQRLTCARAQGVALLGGYSVYSEAVPESLLSLSLCLSLSQGLNALGLHLYVRCSHLHIFARSVSGAFSLGFFKFDVVLLF